jgi:hypothetical protein
VVVCFSRAWAPFYPASTGFGFRKPKGTPCSFLFTAILKTLAVRPLTNYSLSIFFLKNISRIKEINLSVLFSSEIPGVDFDVTWQAKKGFSVLSVIFYEV